MSIFEDFFNELMGVFNQQSKASHKDSIKKHVDRLKATFGGKVETEVKQVYLITKKYTSEDGQITQSFQYVSNEEPNMSEVEIENLKQQLKDALSKEEYEKCVEIRDKIRKLENK